MLQPAETILHAKLCEKLRKRILASEILTRVLITPHLFKTEKCRMYQMKGHSEGFSKLVVYHSCRFQRRRKMVSNVQSHYGKVK